MSHGSSTFGRKVVDFETVAYICVMYRGGKNIRDVGNLWEKLKESGFCQKLGRKESMPLRY